MPAASFSFPYERYERYGVDPGIKFEDKVALPPPWHYDAYPLLNAATHATGDAHYYPDRQMQRVSKHSTEPFFLSLPQTEQNRLWEKQLFPKHQRKKRMDELSAADAEKLARTGKHPDEPKKHVLDPIHRVMPFCAHTRMPVGHGVWPHIKHVQSEPGFQAYKPQDGTTRTFEWHRQQHRKKVVKHGMQVLREKLMGKDLLKGCGGGPSLTAALRLAADQKVAEKTGLAKNLKQRKRHVHGLGEAMTELSFQEFRQTNGMPVSSMC